MASTYTLNSSSYGGRKLVLTCSQTKNIATNKSTINWTLTSTGGSADYYSTGPTTVKINGTQVYYSARKEWNTYQFPAARGSVSGSIVVEHTSDGSKSISCSIATAIYTASVTTQSGTWTLDNIPRNATITSAPDFNDEGNPTITYSNPAGSNVTSLQACISLTGSVADIPYRDISKTGTSYTFNLTTAERNTLRNACTDANSRTVKFVIKTVISGTTLTNTVTKTLSIINANPTFTASNISYADTNSSVVAITTNNQNIVQNKSNLQVTYTAATGNKGATISSYEFILNGVTRTSSSAGGTINFGTVNSSSNLTLTCNAIDSRGNITSIPKTITILEYSSPSAIITLNRLNNYEDETYLTVDGSVSSVDNKNIMTIKYKYKESGGSYGSFTTIPDNVRQTLSLDKNKVFVFNIVVTDSFSSEYSTEIALGKGVFPLFIDTSMNSVGINGFPTHDGAFEVTGDIYQNGAKIIETGSNANGNWIKFADGTMICTLNIIVTDQAINTAYGSLYQGYRVWNYPQTFIERPTVNCSQFFWGTSASWGSVSGVYGASCTLRGHDVQSRATGTSCQICATAIGKWK